MIRAVLTEVREGYRYPDDLDRRYHLTFQPNAVEPIPTRAERVNRAARWGWAELREILAERVHPDG